MMFAHGREEAQVGELFRRQEVEDGPTMGQNGPLRQPADNRVLRAARQMSIVSKEHKKMIVEEIGQLAVSLHMALLHIEELQELSWYDEDPIEGPVYTQKDINGKIQKSVDWEEFRAELTGIKYNLKTAIDSLDGEFTQIVMRALVSCGIPGYADDTDLVTALRCSDARKANHMAVAVS